MEKPLILSVAAQASINVLQITDTHLFAASQGTLLGINTRDSYQAVLQAIHCQSAPCDLVVATGDLVQDQSVAAYQHFVTGIVTIPAPCVWLPGNHDFQPNMYQALKGEGISAAKQVIAGCWQILLLDSQVPGVAHGRLSHDQLNWLQHKLTDEPQRHTLLLLHHHPVPSGCDWLDQHGLRNARELDGLLAQFPLVKHLLYGHIHQEADTVWNGRRLLATPSTCIQFKPDSADFALDQQAPGWRWLCLHPDGSISTEVRRLAQGRFLPDADSAGY